jgi:hypothetical protein
MTPYRMIMVQNSIPGVLNRSRDAYSVPKMANAAIDS